VTQIFHSGHPSHGGDSTISELMTSISPKGTISSVASVLVATLDQGHPDRNHKLWIMAVQNETLRQKEIISMFPL
jgi:hypothetical protein